MQIFLRQGRTKTWMQCASGSIARKVCPNPRATGGCATGGRAKGGCAKRIPPAFPLFEQVRNGFFIRYGDGANGLHPGKPVWKAPLTDTAVTYGAIGSNSFGKLRMAGEYSCRMAKSKSFVDRKRFQGDSFDPV
ncbi:MAG: hypothetical protein A2Z99_19515 [Treponema sp. GWB1_62_6]|nr:MAG: hypothetical protein A2001_11975 [Treponema sp. GWC1_61_84]OHE72236.1 MAG: hypothetical protein A2Z99_19515 [Treponema sp. GWB1_62_6]OHE72414.1 MAG: hypothetical protein A2413_03720 [Treponema sp. RIFOXYC1_FULL_61_9]HCM28591.1 hypothetical protein [Treponema sp.]